MKTALKILLLPLLLALGVLELASRFLSRTAQIIVTAIGGILLFIIVISAVFCIAPTKECIRNGIVIATVVTVVNLTAAVPILLEAARTALSEKLI